MNLIIFYSEIENYFKNLNKKKTYAMEFDSGVPALGDGASLLEVLVDKSTAWRLHDFPPV